MFSWFQYACLFLAIFCCQMVQAFPTGAGGCPEGRAAVGGTHIVPTATITTGSLEDHSFQVRINGRILQPGTKLILQTGVEQAWTLSSSDRGFRGFLLRLSGGPDQVDTTVALSSASASVQEAYAACIVTEEVGGVTHTDRELKTAVSGILRLDEVADDLKLDVTVVVQNQNRESIYYYSEYTIEFRERADASSTPPPTPPPTFGPTAGPAKRPAPSPTSTQQPTTSAPTSFPIMMSATPLPTTSPSTPKPTTTTLDPSRRPSLRPSVPRDDAEPVVLLSLVDIEGDCTPDRPCGRCQGDCDTHADCVGALECYRRPGDYGTPVPGCQGMGTPGRDYCYEPSSLLVLRLRTPVCSSAEPCDLCQGDCNSDDDCQGTLQCFQRRYQDTTSVPGCHNLGFQAIPYEMRRSWTGLDYCYNPNFAQEEKDESSVIETFCDSDDDCLPIACFEEPCISFVCRNSRCVFIERCGTNECQSDEFCCNKSCNLCVPIGGSCRQEECPPSDGQAVAGGDTTVADMVFCESNKDCIAPECLEEPCLSFVCRDLQCTFVEKCGTNECGPDEYCCSETCSMCAPIGTECNCVQCGDVVCVGKEICCGSGCGICKPDGGSCPDICSTLGSGGNGQGESQQDDNRENDPENDGTVVEIVFCESDDDCNTPECTEEPCMSNICFNFQCVLVGKCGKTYCDPDEFCCNESCSICVPAGGSCPQDECQTCGDEICNVGDVCCSHDCGICYPPGGSCPSICNTPVEEPINAAEEGTTSCTIDDDCSAPECIEEPCLSYICQNSQCTFVEKCGSRICSKNEDCCNESCNLCVPLGGTCSRETCEPCGDDACNPGDTCCNPRCSICRAPGGSCPNICNDYWFLPEWKETVPTAAPTIAPTDASSNETTIEPTRASTFAPTKIPMNPNDYNAGRETCTTDVECENFVPCMTDPCPRYACRDFQCQLIQPCGNVECGEFEICCSETCSICMPLHNDVGCTDDICQSITDENLQEDQLVECETTLDCPVFLCFEAQCPQIECRDRKCLLFIPCGEERCDETEICCCGTCSPKGTVCEVCEPCGSAFCPPAQVCCNESCSICTPPGGFCSAEYCFEDDDDTLTALVVAKRKPWG